jgi:hypothetical protein
MDLLQDFPSYKILNGNRYLYTLQEKRFVLAERPVFPRGPPSPVKP